ncbi:MAG: topoisomerase DNA-binding C4 zinc finger domain-containing protein, partial [Selenomonadaceae bacterium]|nr:topoisomerase DNA-binding C4 zinc finger domain-containing protein [Selenomonadaceae bacterium]
MFEDDNGKPDFDGKIRSARLIKEGAPKCPNCGNALVKRKGAHGEFWGCSAYPKCQTSFSDKDGKPNFDGKKSRRPKKLPSRSKKFSAPENFNLDDFEPIISSADFD